MTQPARLPVLPVTVEILIVSFNTAGLLADCLSSIEAHRPQVDVATVFIAVFDNASGDGSADLVRERFPWVRLVTSDDNIGFAKANNRLAAQSIADYVLLLNSDTRLTTDLVAPLLAALVSDPDAVIASPRLVFPDGEVQYSSERFPRIRYEAARELIGTKLDRLRATGIRREVSRVRRTHDIETRQPHRADFLWATCWLMPREEIVNHGLFDDDFTTYDEDLDFCRRLIRRGGIARYVAGVELIHIGGASSSSQAKRGMVRDARQRYYERHGTSLQAFGYRLLKGAFAWLKR
jgi:N-acetylglucosaminyl-diphospho-decaprenol L-rhamnosyltransferase